MFLDDLTDEERRALVSIGESRTFEVGAILIEEDVLGTSFSLILEGDVEVRKRLTRGQHKKLIELGPQEVIGEMGFLGIGSRSASVVALTQGALLEFDREEFNRFISAHPVIGQKIYRGMAQELAERLKQGDEDLMNALAWALDQVRVPTSDSSVPIPERGGKLKLSLSKSLPRNPSVSCDDESIIL